jgi:hypothetical protein
MPWLNFYYRWLGASCQFLVGGVREPPVYLIERLRYIYCGDNRKTTPPVLKPPPIYVQISPLKYKI